MGQDEGANMEGKAEMNIYHLLLSVCLWAPLHHDLPAVQWHHRNSWEFVQPCGKGSLRTEKVKFILFPEESMPTEIKFSFRNAKQIIIIFLLNSFYFQVFLDLKKSFKNNTENF